MKRIILMLTVAALLVASLVVTAAPGFAKACGPNDDPPNPGHSTCYKGGGAGAPDYGTKGHDFR